MYKLRKIIRWRMFSLVELMVSMFIFLLMMGVMMRYFTAANQIWRSTAKKNEVYSNARIAMNLMVRDLQCAMYNNDWETTKGIYPFWQTGASGTLGEKLCFISTSPIKSNSAVSSICELRYSIVAQNSTVTSGSETIPEFWLIRSSVGDNEATKYNFDSYPMSSFDVARMTNIFQDTSSGDWQKVVPYVVDLEFKCYELDTSSEIPTATIVAGSVFPSRITINLSIIDKNTYKKYLKIKDTMGQTKADTFLNENKLTFSRTVFLRKRGSS
jgi:hypothetical protein